MTLIVSILTLNFSEQFVSGRPIKQSFEHIKTMETKQFQRIQNRESSEFFYHAISPESKSSSSHTNIKASSLSNLKTSASEMELKEKQRDIASETDASNCFDVQSNRPTCPTPPASTSGKNSTLVGKIGTKRTVNTPRIAHSNCMDLQSDRVGCPTTPAKKL